ncbi:MAG: hypothetical protein Homavirus32_4 [Homavirus sp.]|uniref:Uncharacterized protein n=1 Tax=Homavirus sp. TaxID=2487769 RepID=A0A3G5A520_9VIRU|nr:MAG: hypothetical protein Homavirus32_4 [Homavirus sp.]
MNMDRKIGLFLMPILMIPIIIGLIIFPSIWRNETYNKIINYNVTVDNCTIVYRADINSCLYCICSEPQTTQYCSGSYMECPSYFNKSDPNSVYTCYEYYIGGKYLYLTQSKYDAQLYASGLENEYEYYLNMIIVGSILLSVLVFSWIMSFKIEYDKRKKYEILDQNNQPDNQLDNQIDNQTNNINISPPTLKTYTNSEMIEYVDRDRDRDRDRYGDINRDRDEL